MKFLRTILLHNLVIKLLSLVLAVLTWMYVARQIYLESIAKEESTSSIVELSGEKLIVKRLPIYVNIQGSPQKGFHMVLDKIILEPTHAMIAGPSEAIAGLSYITTEPVNVEGAVSTVRKNIKIMPVPKCRIGYDGLVNVTIPIIKERRI